MIEMRAAMLRTIQMTIDDALLEQVDAASDELAMSRSAFIRKALQQAMDRFRIAELERKHAAGYAHHPVEPGEFDLWEAEQVWSQA